ncbi:gliding motility-associated C-terminal domain-containing protein, partial [Flavobacterium sp. SLB02]
VANLDSAGSVVGGNTSQTLINVLDNDTKNGTKLNPSDVKLTPGTDPKGYLTIDTNGNAVLGANAPAGNYELTYEICELLNPTNCATNKIEVTVTAPAILAVKENLGPINGSTGGSTTSLIASDTLNGVQAVIGSNPGEVTLRATAPTGFTVNPTDGTVRVSAGVKAGSYDVEYTICDNNNPATNCSTATSTVVVTAADLVANLDSAGSVVGGNTSQTLINVLDNDTKNGTKLNPSDVKLTPGTDPKGYLTIDTNGNAVLGANAPAGNYELTYEICELLNPTNCATNKIEVTVKPGALQANNDNAGTVDTSKGQSSTTSIFDNDTLNGSKVNPSDVVLTTLVPNPNLILKANGIIEIKPGTPTGTYELTYQICEALNPTTNCSQAIAKISVVNNPPITPLIQIIANNDGIVNVDGINGALEFINVLDNDLVKGLPVNPLEIVLSNTPSPYFEFNSDGTVNVKPNTPGGSYSLTYQVCEKSNPNNCASATLSVFVEVPSIAIIKTAVFNDENGSGFANAGETITYKFKVTNTGNVPLTGVMIADPLPGVVVSGQAINLNVNESDQHNFTAIYKITQSDINKGSVSNQASVQARSAKGVVVDDLSDDENETGDKPTVLGLNGCAIKVFNAFSPNGDDINSRFYIRGLECYPDNTVEIYNRWGVLVYDIDNYNNDDRAFKGFSEGRTTVKQSEGLPVGTYFYILKYKDSGSNPHELSGYLYINK